MAYELPGFRVGVLPTDVDLSAASNEFIGVCVYTAVSVSGAGVGGAALCLPSSTSSPIIGVIQNAPAQGQAGTVVIDGISKVQLGGSVNPGDLLMCQSTGTFVKATAGNFAVAQALEKGSSGDISTALLIRNGKQ